MEEQPQGGSSRINGREEGRDMAEYKYVLELNDIVKLFPGVRALDGMSLKIRSGAVHVICGENGAGKSTLMKVISGEYIAEEGEVIYKGKKLGNGRDGNIYDTSGNESHQKDDIGAEYLSCAGAFNKEKAGRF